MPITCHRLEINDLASRNSMIAGQSHFAAFGRKFVVSGVPPDV